MRAREKEELVEFELFIADIYWLRNLSRRVRSVVRKALRLGMFSSRGQREEKRLRTIYWEIYLWRIFKLHFTSPLHLRR